MSAANDSSFSSLSSSSLSSQTFPQIILASTSRYRHDLLSRLALPFEVMAPDYDEEIALEKFAKTPHFPDPCYLTAFFSLGKAQSVQRLQQAKHSVSFDSERSIIIGSDQVAFFK
jgi:septum formation protein